MTGHKSSKPENSEGLSGPHNGAAHPDRFELLSTHIPLGVLVQDRHTEIVWCNPAALNLFGLTRDQLIGRTSFDPAWNAIHPDGSAFPSDGHPVLRAIRERQVVREAVMGVSRPQGGRVWLEVHAIPLVTDHGDVDEVICVLRDLGPYDRRTAAATTRTSDVAVGDMSLAVALAGESVASERLRGEVEAAARTLDHLPVLILGEPGTGKTLVARALHALSSRRKGAFEAVNCAGISASLFESEVFGHERGAFTGADAAKPGRFELANGGVLLLDEIADLPWEQQAKLLTALQERTVRHLGGKRDIHVDIAVIAATNRDLTGMVSEHQFRQDLFDRLNGFLVRVPSLRERRDDLEPLTQRLVDTSSRRLGKSVRAIHPDVLAAFHQYNWPGNVRQLDFVVRRMIARATGDRLTPDLLPEELLASSRASIAGIGTDVSKTQIQNVLEATEGNIRRAAQRLGISRSRFYRLLDKYGLR